jgi:hypothetical protein
VEERTDPFVISRFALAFQYLRYSMLHHMCVVQTQVVNHIMQNGGSDPKGSGFIFHFREFGDVIDCRDSMRIAVPAAFHFSFETTNMFNAPPEVPMASVWIIIKTAVLSTDYREDKHFLQK